MYPLLLEAPLKDYIWGGSKLKDEYGFVSDMDRVSEAWVLSCHEDGKCIIKNGRLSGKTLNEAILEWGSASLGSRADLNEMPILVKLIDAKNRLSVQVHPNDEYARKNENDNGKTELWYVIDCCEGAKLVYGLNKAISKEEFERHISDNTLDSVLNYVDVHKGDAFFITSGTIHAIGAGILIAEIQENSNVTYRVSDYGRLGADGKPRQLHVKKAVEVSNLSPSDYPYGAIGETVKSGNVTFRRIISCQYFTGGVIAMNASADYSICEKNTFVSLVVLKGSAALFYDGVSMDIPKGRSVFIPAGIECRIHSNESTEILYSSL